MLGVVNESAGTGTAAQIPGVAGRGQDRDRGDRARARTRTRGSSRSRRPTHPRYAIAVHRRARRCRRRRRRGDGRARRRAGREASAAGPARRDAATPAQCGAGQPSNASNGRIGCSHNDAGRPGLFEPLRDRSGRSRRAAWPRSTSRATNCWTGPVALKALFPEYAREPSFVERFRREAQAAANLNHPNIVAIYDWGQEAGTYFIVMEYVEGRSLRDLIRARGAARPEPGRRDHRRDRVGARVRAPQRCRAPRREAGQRAAHAVGHRQGHRLRHRARRGERRAHADRFGHGHRHVLLTRAGAGTPGRRPQRRVLARRRALRDGHAASRRSPATRPSPSRTSTCAKTSCRRRNATPTSRPTSSRSSSPRSPRIRTTATRPPTTCAPTSCASAAAARSPPRRSPRSSPRCRRPRPPRGLGVRGNRYATPARRRPRRARSAGPRTRASARTPRSCTILTLLALAAIILGDPVPGDQAGNERGTRHRARARREEGRAPRRPSCAQLKLVPEVTRVISQQPVDTVIDQTPKAGKSVTEKTTVNLTVSSGLEQVTIPFDVKNKEAAGRDRRSSRGLGFVVRTAARIRQARIVDKGRVDRQQARRGLERRRAARPSP